MRVDNGDSFGVLGAAMLWPSVIKGMYLGRVGGRHPTKLWAIEEMGSPLSRTGALGKSALATDY